MSIEHFRANGHDYTSYGGDVFDPTSDFNNVPADHGFLSWLGDLMPEVVGGIFTAGMLPGAGGGAGGGAGAAGGGGGMSGGVPWGSVITAGSNLFGSLFGAHAQASAADKAAALQAASQAQALAFEKQQAENAYLNNETARKANYGQWAAREKRLGSIAEALGYGSRDVPDYVAGVDPHFTGGAPPPSGTTGTVTNGAYTPPPTLPSYAALTGSDGLTPRPLPSSVGAALGPSDPSLPLDPVTGRPIPPGTLRMPAPAQWGPVGSYL